MYQPPTALAEAVPPATKDSPLSKQTQAALRLLRTEVEELQAELRKVRAGDRSLDASTGNILRTANDIERRLAVIPDKWETTLRIRNHWERVRDLPLLGAGPHQRPMSDQLRELDRVDAACAGIVKEIGFATIPSRLNEWLARSTPGFHLPFHRLFEDELPDREERERMLEQLALVPGTIPSGMIDTTSGYVYRCFRRTWANIAAALAVAGALVVVFLGLQSAPAAQFLSSAMQGEEVLVGTMGALWAAAFVGILFHAAVGTAKRTRSLGGLHPLVSPVLAFRWVTSRMGYLAWAAFLSLVVVVALFGLFPGDQRTLLNAFLLGYGGDSVLELLTPAIEGASAKRTEGLKKRLEKA